MKAITTLKRFWIVAIIVSVFVPASAQFKIGPRVGLEVNSLRFDMSTFDSNNRAGFTAGLQAEFTVPIIGIGADMSVMYAHRTQQWKDANNLQSAKSDYIEIPVNLKYKLNIPAVKNVIAPYVFTGPSFAILASKQDISEFFKAKKCDIAWNFGLGVELVKHLQIGASYGVGMTEALRIVKLSDNKSEIEGKNKYWTVTAAWLF